MKKIFFIQLFILLYIFVFSQDKTINILCYHKFTTKAEEDVKDKKKQDVFSITAERFEEHLKFLKENGYNVISMKKYLSFLDGIDSIPSNSVIITIDDGYRSIYDIAFPLLKKYGFPATVYIYSVFFGGRNNLNEGIIKEMSKYNIDFGCHSYTHQILTKRKSSWSDSDYLSFLEKEIIKSKIFFESKLKIPFETFAYPYGLYSKEVVYMIKKAGYRAAFSVVPGVNTPETSRYALHRTLIFNSTGVENLKKILCKKPIKIKDVYPSDSEVLEDRKIEFRAFLIEDAGINTGTIKFKLNNKELKDVNYDSITKKLSCYQKKPLSDGAYVITISTRGLSGEEYEYSWLFVIGKPANTGLYLEK